MFKSFKPYGEIYEIRDIGNGGGYIHFRSLEDTPNNPSYELREQHNRPIPYEMGPNKPATSASFAKSLLIAPDQSDCNHILNVLNDDCLYEVFKPLHLLDLCAVANVCVRFRHIAQSVFQLKYANFHFNLNRLRYSYDSYVTLNQMDLCLRLFGEQITRMDVDCVLHEDVILGMISEYCPNLKVLEFDGSTISLGTVQALRPLIATLDAFHLNCLDERTTQLFASNCAFQRLFLRNSSGIAPLPVMRFAQMIEITLSDLHLKEPEISKFLELNRQIRKLEIIGGQVNDFKIISCSPRHLQHLEELKLSFDCPLGSSLIHWNDFRRLRVLELTGKDFPITAILGALHYAAAPLERLKLRYTRILHPNFIDFLCRMKSIIDLEFITNAGHLNDSQLISIAQNLPNLQHLVVNSKLITTDGIRQMLKYADRLKASSFHVHSDGWTSKDCDAIAKAIQDRVQMTVLICNIEVSSDFRRGRLVGFSFSAFLIFIISNKFTLFMQNIFIEQFFFFSLLR